MRDTWASRIAAPFWFVTGWLFGWRKREAAPAPPVVDHKCYQWELDRGLAAMSGMMAQSTQLRATAQQLEEYHRQMANMPSPYYAQQQVSNMTSQLQQSEFDTLVTALGGAGLGLFK